MAFARLPGLAAPRRALTSALGLVLTSACTTLLGIDGTYAVGSVGVGGETNSSGGSGGSGEAGGESASGGSENVGAAGVAGAAGEATSPGSGGAQPTKAGPSTGGVEPTDGAPLEDLGCKAGRYAGNLSGTHKPSFTGGLLPVGVKGKIVFTLDGTGPTLQMTGSINGELQTLGAFIGTLTGSYSCETHQVSAQLSGTMTSATVAGTLTGDLLSSNEDARSWTEHEKSFTPTSTYGGSGTWDATWTGP